MSDEAKARALEAQIGRARQRATTQQRRLVVRELRRLPQAAAR